MFSVSGIKKMEFVRYRDYPDATWMKLTTAAGEIEATIHIPLDDLIAQLRQLACVLETNSTLNKNTNYVIEEHKDATIPEAQTSRV